MLRTIVVTFLLNTIICNKHYLLEVEPGESQDQGSDYSVSQSFKGEFLN